VYSYFIVYKPFQVLSQFTSGEGKRTLKDFFEVPGDLYPVGRLDFDSEGLLILTNDTKLNHRLLNPKFMHDREYWVQVEGSIGNDALRQLATGISINIDGRFYQTAPAESEFLDLPLAIPERDPPIRYRAHIPTSWIKIVLKEGKNRQVRKMTAKTGFPTLRLIRYRIEGITLEGLRPGDMRSMTKEEIYAGLGW
jgi:23S rRNA pseudouridine2457 synthase